MSLVFMVIADGKNVARAGLLSCFGPSEDVEG